VRYLALDIGDKRTGLATGDDETGIVSPGRVLERPAADRPGLLAALRAALAEHSADALVVGLPLNMDDSEGPQARKVRALAEFLAQGLGLALHLQDEQLTSADADGQMAQSGLTHGQKKSRRDALAAAAILRDFLSAQRPDPAGATDEGLGQESGPAGPVAREGVEPMERG
jgi:putative Holliday junction resolvase